MNSSCDVKGKPYKCRPRRGKVPMHMKGADRLILEDELRDPFPARHDSSLVHA